MPGAPGGLGRPEGPGRPVGPGKPEGPGIPGMPPEDEEEELEDELLGIDGEGKSGCGSGVIGAQPHIRTAGSRICSTALVEAFILVCSPVIRGADRLFTESSTLGTWMVDSINTALPNGRMGRR